MTIETDHTGKRYFVFGLLLILFIMTPFASWFIYHIFSQGSTVLAVLGSLYLSFLLYRMIFLKPSIKDAVLFLIHGIEPLLSDEEKQTARKRMFRTYFLFMIFFFMLISYSAITSPLSGLLFIGAAFVVFRYLKEDNAIGDMVQAAKQMWKECR